MTTTIAARAAQAPARHAAPSRTKVVVATTIGNALEFFDFTVYSFFAILIGKLFFPVSTAQGQLLLSVATFGVGFVTRPLGGIVIGQYADRYGRKAAMVMTIMLMALGCAMIAAAPTYAQIGLAAPLIIVAARLLQGFSAGGEVGVSVTMLVENGTNRNRGFFASWQFASQGLGIMVGAGIAAALSHYLSPAALESWGWRVPFALGVLIAPVGMYIRRQLHETLIVQEASSGASGTSSGTGKLTRADLPNPLMVLLRSYKFKTMLGVLLIMGGTVSSYIILLYMPTYAIRELGIPSDTALLASVMSAGITFVFGPFVGKMADAWGRKPLILIGRIASLIAIYPCFLWLNAAPSASTLLLMVAGLSILLTLHAVPTITMIPEMIPNAVRATSMSVTYSIGVALFGGFAQLIAVWLIAATGSKLAPAWYVIASLVLSTWPLLYMADRTGSSIDD
jgi:MHS family proline/betaine transporter-like MFS transporter